MIPLLKKIFHPINTNTQLFKESEIEKEDQFQLLYYEFKDWIIRRVTSNIHYLDHTPRDIQNKVYSFKHKTYINAVIKRLIYGYSDSLFTKKSLYNRLSYLGNTKPKEIYLTIYQNLIKEIQEQLDTLIESRLKYFIGETTFYEEYNNFNSIDRLNEFLIENIFKEIKLDQYYLKFHIKNNYEPILQEYFKQSIIFIRDNKDTYSLEKIKNEINRLKNLVLKHNFLFLKEHINQLEELKNDLTPTKSIEKKTTIVDNSKDIYENIKVNELKDNFVYGPFKDEIFNLILKKDFYELDKFKHQLISKKDGIKTAKLIFELNNKHLLYSEDDLKIFFSLGVIKCSNETIFSNSLFRKAKTKFHIN